MRDNIILIGFSGTGKSTVGRILADRLGWNLVDTDEEIEGRLGMSVEQIFAQFGEPFFREQERLAVENLVNRKNLVIATGGGVVLSDANVANLKACGAMVCLVASAEVILARITNDPVARPLLNNPEKITSLLHVRAGKYLVADFAVETEKIDAQVVADTIMVKLNLKGATGC